ncbi:hypothetical protein PHMEG_00020064, partial [Phytophthora megakarya]
MGSYFMEDPRLYSRYDEYTGIFGPLQAHSSSGFRSRGRLPPTRRGFSDSRNLGNSSNLRTGRRSVPREFDRRTKFLAKRKAKKSFQPVEDDSGGNQDLQDKENEPQSPTHGLQRQVWLPTRNFAFRQRSGKLDTRAIARLDLEKIAATTDIETIQRHLENLAFADVTLDDVQHYSDAYFLKLFQIAQLTLEYLMHVQDSLVDHSEGLEKQCEELMTECQELETENGQHETEIASLKREIRQKQRTMATLELMLLNASAANRISSSAKENAAREANVLVDELLDKRTDPTAEEGSITNPVACVLCGKRFVSAEYLLRHQQRRHQDEQLKKRKKKKKAGSSSGSSSDSDSKKKKQKPQKQAQLPKEILDALEEKNQLAKQLMTLQDQVRMEQEVRDRQRQQLENQQNQMNSRVEHFMERLQSTLVEIEKKQETTKQDLRQYTQESIARLQVEAANAELLRIQTQKTSRAGRLENDDGEDTTKSKDDDAKWAEKVEKLMDTFLRAQSQKQQEIDVLEQESSKLWAKYNKLKKKHHRPEPTMRLEDLTALDAERFGIDRGEVVETEIEKPIVKPVARLEDKLIQTDEEDEGKHFKQVPKPEPLPQIQAEPKPNPVVVPPIRIEKIQRFVSPPLVKQTRAPPPKEENTPIVPPPPVEEKEPKPTEPRAKFQHAAHVIGKMALGFLARRTLARTSNWRIMIEISSLEATLTPPELEYVRQHYDSQIHVQVEENMTANNLRVKIAKELSGKDEFEPENIIAPVENEELEITATMTYHRVLLHHKQTGVELSGDMFIHDLKNAIEVEIIPYHESTAFQVGEVIKTHTIISDHAGSEDLKLLPNAEFEKHSTELSAEQKEFHSDTQRRIQRITERLPPIATGEYHRRKTENQGVKTRSAGAAKIHRAVQVEVVRKRLKRLIDDNGIQQATRTGTGGMKPNELAPPLSVTTKSLMSSWLSMSRESLRPVDKSIGMKPNELAPPLSVTTKSLMSSWLSMSRESIRPVDKSIDSFDPNEIDQLANAYEEGNSPVQTQTAKALEEIQQIPPSTEVKEEIDQLANAYEEGNSPVESQTAKALEEIQQIPPPTEVKED